MSKLTVETYVPATTYEGYVEIGSAGEPGHDVGRVIAAGCGVVRAFWENGVAIREYPVATVRTISEARYYEVLRGWCRPVE